MYERLKVTKRDYTKNLGENEPWAGLHYRSEKWF